MVSRLSLSLLFWFFVSASWAGSSELEEIVVAASRVEMPVRAIGSSISILTQDDLELSSATSLIDVLRTQPGIAASNAGGAGKQSSLRIRGEEGFRTLMLIDGVEITDVTGTQAMPQAQHFNAGIDIERIEILRGPQGFAYGADAGGVIRLSSYTGEEPMASFRIGYGSDATQQLEGAFGGTEGELTAFVALSDYQTDGFNAHIEDVSEDEDGYQNTTMHGKFGLQVSPQARFQLVLRDVQGASEYDNCYYPDGSGSFQPGNDCLSEYDQQIGKLSFDHQFRILHNYVAISTSDVKRSRIAHGTSGGVSDGSLKKLEYQNRIDVSKGLVISSGVDYREEINRTADNQHRRQIGSYFEVNAEIFDSSYVSFGLRRDNHEEFGGHLSGRITGASIQSLGGGGKIKYRFSYGSGFRAPSLYEINYNSTSFVSLPELREETSHGGDIGLDYYGTQGVSAGITLFDQHITNEIDFDLVSYTGYLQVEGVSHSRGVELNGNYPLNQFLGLELNYTYNDTLSAEDQRRTRRPRHLANLSLKGHFFEDTLRIMAHARMSHDAVDEVYGQGRIALEDYHVVDFSMRLMINEHISLNLDVRNLTGENYREVSQYYTDDGSTMLAITGKF